MNIAAGDSDSDNYNSDAFICAILTHGEEGVVYGTDAKIEIEDLLKPFKGSSCAGLVGKPKIFFIQVKFHFLADAFCSRLLFKSFWKKKKFPILSNFSFSDIIVLNQYFI